MKMSRLFPLLALGLSSCVQFPVYESQAVGATARLNMATLYSGWICAEGKRYQLKADADGYAPIPAGQRITVGRSFYAQGYNVSYHCNSAISFVPVAGASYYGHFELAAEQCRVEIYREGAANRIGLAFEPTLGSPTSCGS